MIQLRICSRWFGTLQLGRKPELIVYKLGLACCFCCPSRSSILRICSMYLCNKKRLYHISHLELAHVCPSCGLTAVSYWHSQRKISCQCCHSVTDWAPCSQGFLCFSPLNANFSTQVSFPPKFPVIKRSVCARLSGMPPL